MHAQLRAVEHPQAENVEVRAVARGHHLGEAGDVDARYLALLPSRLDVLPQLVVTKLFQGNVHSFRIVAAVVDPARRRRVWELFGLDEVVHAKLGLIKAELES